MERGTFLGRGKVRRGGGKGGRKGEKPFCQEGEDQEVEWNKKEKNILSTRPNGLFHVEESRKRKKEKKNKN